MTSYKTIIRALEELHAPHEVNRIDGEIKLVCNSCKTSYPCVTIQLIQEEAGNV
jgi:hypothetical protein